MTTQQDQTPTLRPVSIPGDGGDARWWFGSLAVIKATAADTGGQMTLVEITEPPDVEAPLHVHHNEDEGFWILDGSVRFEVGGATLEARAGDYAFGPRHIPHRYTVGPDGCRMLFMFTPGGFEDLLRATSEPATARTLPPPATEPPDMERLSAVVRAHRSELLDG